MGYPEEYNRVLKFGRAPEQGIGTFIRAAHGQPVSHANNHDAVLADYLEDHDDNRHLIVRRHLERTKRPGSSLVGELNSQGMDPIPTDANVLETPDGRVVFHHYQNSENGQKAVAASWVAAHPDNLPGRTYHAVLTPAEAHRIHSEFAPRTGPAPQAHSSPVEIY